MAASVVLIAAQIVPDLMIKATGDIFFGIAAIVFVVAAIGLAIVGVGIVGEILSRVGRTIAALRRDERRYGLRTLVGLLALGFAWFIWPTPYRPFGAAGVMQVNRFTGAKCAVGESCWRTGEAASPWQRLLR